MKSKPFLGVQMIHHHSACVYTLISIGSEQTFRYSLFRKPSANIKIIDALAILDNYYL